jgi:AraC-like DNA-binding protein
MKLDLNIYALIPFLALLQGLIFAVLLTIRGYREERYSDFWLAISLFFSAINGVPYMLGWMGYNELWNTYTYLPWDGFWFVIPVCLYLFLKSLTNQAWRFSVKRDFVHFLPYGIYFIVHLVIGVLGFGNREQIWKWENTLYLNVFFQVLSWGVQIYYFVASYQLYKNYRNWAVNEYSNIELVSFTWFRNFLIINFLCWTIGTINSLYISLFTNETSDNHYALMWIGYLADTILLYYISISGFMQSRVKHVVFEEKGAPLSDFFTEKNKDTVHSQVKLNDGETIQIQDENKKNQLSEEDLLTWKTKVMTLFDKGKPYLDPELTLSELAIRLKTNTSILSQVINKGFEKNFNDFINEYRVHEYHAKVKTPQYKHLTILAVALDCGFNSKATFNRAYKKLTGKNPSDF